MNPTYERGPSSDIDVGLNTPTTARHRFCLQFYKKW